MFPIQIPAFGETKYFDNQENQAARVVLIPDATAADFASYCLLLEKTGFISRQTFAADHRSFAAYEKDGWGVYINYFAGTAQLQLVMEEKTAYFSYADDPGNPITSARLTLVSMSDDGLSVVIRLSDGRLIIVDGANIYEHEVDSLFARLKKDSPNEKPVIAAWIFTHPHSDHYFCFFPFMQKYGEAVTIEKFLFNFPEGDDLEHYPLLATDQKRFTQWSGENFVTGGEILCRFREQIATLGIPVYTPHTGQQYTIGDAHLQFFATMDDTIHHSQSINATSLMFTLEICGQKVFFGGDGSFSDACLPERYGQELKSDILQVPHHGFGCGTAEAQIQGYRQIRPRVCLLPTSHQEAYTSYATHREGTRYLMTAMDIEEMITGWEERTLDLPYTPDPAGAIQLRQRYLEGRDNCGARTWIFTDLNTARKEDFLFSVLNTAFIDADIQVELFFDDLQKKVIYSKNKGPRRRVSRMNCLFAPEEDQTAFDHPDFLICRDIPENTYFAVRFISNLPVVISHRDHKPAYHSSVV